LLAQRRLGDMQALRGAAEVKLFRHRQEVAEQAEIYFFIHTRDVSIEANRILDSYDAAADRGKYYGEAAAAIVSCS
jgi:hypothetical protein